MIDTKELRIGNLIQTPKRIQPVTYIDIDEVGFEGQKIESTVLCVGFTSLCYKDSQLEPIQITPEWLERLGFEMVDDDKGFYQIDCGKKSKLLYDLDFKLAEIGVEWNENTEEMKHIKYVHQLQNLYHALTGEELQIKA
jgi:hypothetical protein